MKLTLGNYVKLKNNDSLFVITKINEENNTIRIEQPYLAYDNILPSLVTLAQKADYKCTCGNVKEDPLKETCLLCAENKSLKEYEELVLQAKIKIDSFEGNKYEKLGRALIDSVRKENKIEIHINNGCVLTDDCFYDELFKLILESE